MCIYQQVTYTCKHVKMTRKVYTCGQHREFLAGQRASACTVKDTHPLKRYHVEAECLKCQKLDQTMSQAKVLMRELRQKVEKLTGKKPDGTEEAEDVRRRSIEGAVISRLEDMSPISM